jgi:integrase/recombinase XerD
MSVTPYKNKKGEIIPDAWEIACYPKGRKGKLLRKVVKNTTAGNARLIELALLRTASTIVTTHDPTINDKWHEWLKHYARDNGANTIIDINYASLRLLPHFGSWHLSQLTLPLMEDYLDKRALDTWRPPIKNPDPAKIYAPAKPIGKRRINTEMKYLKLFLDYCVKMRYMIPLHFEVPKFRKLPKRTAIIPGVGEVGTLLENCHDDARLAVLLFHDAGLRKTEAFNLEVKDILLDDELIHVIGKGDKERYVAIATKRLYQELEQRVGKVREGLLLRNPRTGAAYKDLRKSIEGAALRAGISKNIYNHLFRHSYISRSHEAGVPTPEIQEQAGHADIKTTRGYIHISTHNRVKQSKKLDKYLKTETASYTMRQKKVKQPQK